MSPVRGQSKHLKRNGSSERFTCSNRKGCSVEHLDYRLVRVEGVSLNSKILARHHSLPAVPGERKLEDQRLRWLRGLLKNGEFNRCDWAWCKCKEDGQTYRVNGQHTDHSLQEVLSGSLEAEFPNDVPVQIQHCEADTFDALGHVFDQFDNHRSVRKPKDRLGIYMAKHSDLEGTVTKDFCDKMLAGIAWGCRHIADIRAVIPEELTPKEAYDRGQLLEVKKVREFVITMFDHAIVPFRAWSQKTGIVANIFGSFLTDDRDDFGLIIEQTLYEVGERAKAFTEKIRKDCQKTGKPVEYYYGLATRYFNDQRKALAAMDRARKEEIKRLIREVQEEDDDDESHNGDAA